MALREPLTYSQLPPILQRELKRPRGCWQQRLLAVVLSVLGTILLVAIFSLPFLFKIGK